MSNQNNTQGRSQKMTPNNNSGRKRRRNNRKPRREQRQAYKWAMQDCTRHYMQALSDPFGLYAADVEVCIPDTLTLPTFKVATQSRITCVIGSSGVGFATHHAGVCGNDRYNLWTSQTGYTGITVSTAAATGVSASRDIRYPYTSGEFRKFRLVGSAIRVRYSGTELNRGGSIIGFNNQSNDPMGLDQAELLSNPASVRYPVTRAWRTVCYIPGDPEAYGFENPSAVSPHSGAQWLGFLLTGVSGETYDVERVSFYEILPTADYTVPHTTKSHSDILGMSAVRDYLGGLTQNVFGPEVYQKGLRAVTNHMLQQTGFPTLTQMGL